MQTSQQSATVHAPDVNRELSQSRPARIVWPMLLGVFWPLASLAAELITGMSADIYLDPIPTLWHVALIAWVPVGNASVIYFLLKGWKIPSGLFLFQAASLGIAAVYWLQFLPWTVFGIILCWTGLGLLPLGPMVAFIATFALRRRCYNTHSVATSPWHGAIGALAGVALLVILEIPTLTAALGLTLATHGSIEQKRRGLAMLEPVAADSELLRFGSGFRPVRFKQELSVISALTRLSQPQPSDVAREVFRATGKPMEIMRGSRRGWDFDRAGTGVGALLPKLSLLQSRVEAAIHPQDSLSYTEWTMTFHNGYEVPQEARSELTLPTGGVISRVTLWVNGEEREAAFAGSSAVRAAYERVVARRMDPLLVTQTGPGRALVQCFPVPPRGEMKIRIGVTAPLLRHDNRLARYIFPRFMTQNFQVASKATATVRDGDRIYHEGEVMADVFEIETPPDEGRRWVYDKRGEQYVVQTTRLVESLPTLAIVVIDGSAALAPHATTLRDLLSRLPNARIILATRFDPLEIKAKDIAPAHFNGGADNLLALQHAVRLGRETEVGAILWVHGPQPVAFAARDTSLNAHGLRLIALQFEKGRNIILEQAGNAPNIETIPVISSATDALRLTIRQLAGVEPVWKTDYATSLEKPVALSSPEGSSHLARLWAAEHIRELHRRGADEEAIRLAQRYQLVTAVSGAVVLENAKQYEEAGLQPVGSDTVPMVPEPASTALFLLGAVALSYFSRRRNQQFQSSQN